MMNDQLDYVFKSNLKMAKVAILMDQTSSTYNALQEKDCYFDGTHTRVRGLKLLLCGFPPWYEMHPQTGNNECKGWVYKTYNNVLEHPDYISTHEKLW